MNLIEIRNFFVIILIQYTFAQLKEQKEGLPDENLNDADKQILEDLKRIRKTLELLGKENFASDLDKDTKTYSTAASPMPYQPPPDPQPPLSKYQNTPDEKPSQNYVVQTTPPSRDSYASYKPQDLLKIGGSTTVKKTFDDFDAENELYKQTPAEPLEVRRKFNGHDPKVVAIATAARKLQFAAKYGLPLDSKGYCPAPPAPECNADSPYRHFDGSCNNLRYPRWGAYLSPYERFMRPSYEDGVHLPRGSMYSDTVGYTSRLPSARKISSTMMQSKNVTDAHRTHMLMQYGQFLDHDLTRTTKEDFNCCDSKLLVKDRCFNIDLVDDYYFYKNKSRTCMELTRSNVHCNKEHDWWEQFNGVTSFIDGSTIYGSTRDAALALRGGEERRFGGKLVTNQDIPNFLPTRKDCGITPTYPSKEDDFVAGDERNQIHATLLSMHVLWLKEHNRIADELYKILDPQLKSLDPKDRDEIIFQETRRIVIAEHQNIVYGEFLPAVLNMDTLKKHHLLLEKDSVYFDLVNPMIRSEFATAAFRYGHSQVQDIFKGRDQPWRLGRFYGDTVFATRSNGDGYQRELEGACTQEALKVDRYMTEELTNNLFNNKKIFNDSSSTAFGSDLASINIQRGRDHGIPGYNQVRKFVGLAPIQRLDDKPQEISAEDWAELASMYRHPDDIDLYPAALTENPLPDSILGPTFSFFIGEQFRVLKDGDRFFFTHRQGEKANGLPDYLQKMVFERKLSDVLCENTKIHELQKFVFLNPSQENPLVGCNADRAKLDFSVIAKYVLEGLTPKST